jgi:HEPN domain-containing protein
MLTPHESWHKNQRKSDAPDSVSPWERSFELWSLLAMIKTYAHQLSDIAAQLACHPIVLVALHQEGIQKVSDFYIAEVQKQLEEAKGLCAELGMRASLIQVNRLLDELVHHDNHSLALAIKETNGRIIDELSGVFFFHVPFRRTEFYDKPWCGDKVETAFRSAIKDIREAGNSFALGRYSAAVFHCMGILQRGLYALANDVKVEFKTGIELENWKNIIDRLETTIDALLKNIEQKQQKGTEKDATLAFYSHLAMEFRYFKNAWRNYVAHLREVYDEQDAKTVLEHVRTFMQRLSERLRHEP